MSRRSYVSKVNMLINGQIVLVGQDVYLNDEQAESLLKREKVRGRIDKPIEDPQPKRTASFDESGNLVMTIE